ncbi:MAG: hypothetical protein K0R61_24 [Microvirga sp.]|nr:hypothetical protein [Microvirga sp.]MDF2969574.1 hypothetical protein [Microvirga sp.]
MDIEESARPVGGKTNQPRGAADNWEGASGSAGNVIKFTSLLGSGVRPGRVHGAPARSVSADFCAARQKFTTLCRCAANT